MGCKPEELLDPQHPPEGVEGPYTIAGLNRSLILIIISVVFYLSGNYKRKVARQAGSIFGFSNDCLLLRRPQVTGAGKLYISFMSLSSLIGRDNSDLGYFLQSDHRGLHHDE